MNKDKKHLNIQGYNVIELMVLIAVFATLALIALPSFLNQARKVKESEATSYVRTINRAQKAYFVESMEDTKNQKSGTFANDIPKLNRQFKITIPRETKNYQYLLRASDRATFFYAIPKEKNLQSYVGAVFVVEPEIEGEMKSAIACKATTPGQIISAEPKLENGVPTCAKGTERIFFNPVSKPEAKHYVGTMNWAQQEYFVENQENHANPGTGVFANDIRKLNRQFKITIPRETKNYQYLLRATDTATFHYAIAKKKELKGYVGAVFMVETAELGTSAILCETTDPGQVIPAEPQMENGVPTCGAETEPL